MLLEITFPLCFIKEQNVVQMYEFLPNLETLFSPYFQRT